MIEVSGADAAWLTSGFFQTDTIANLVMALDAITNDQTTATPATPVPMLSNGDIMLFAFGSSGTSEPSVSEGSILEFTSSTDICITMGTFELTAGPVACTATYGGSVTAKAMIVALRSA